MNMNPRCLVVSLLAPLLLTLPCIVNAADAPPPPADGVHYYVSALNGDDGNPGTMEAPFKSIGRIAPFLQPGQVCLVREGVYRELLKPANSGRADAPVVFRAYPGEDVLLTGLDEVSGWAPVAGTNAYEATKASGLAANRMQVFFNGSIGFEARWPNRTNDDLMQHQAARISTGSTVDTIISADLPAGLPADFFQGGQVWALAGAKWSSWRAPVTGFDPVAKRVSFQTFVGTRNEDWVVSYHNPINGAGGALFYVSGAAKLLDAPKEWFYDTTRKALRVVPPVGFTPGADLVELQTREDAIDLSSRNYVHVEGFRVLAGGANLVNSNYCVVEGVKFAYPSFTRQDFGIHVIGSRTGVYVQGNHNTVRECEISWSWGNGVVLRGNDNKIINNYIHHVNLLGTYATGIEVQANTERNLVAWNTISYTGRDGLIPNGYDHQILHNRISNFGQICDDTGAVYLAGGGVGIELGYNWVHDAPLGMKSGIYMDSFSAGIMIYNNIIWNIPTKAIQINRPGCYHNIFHNTVFGTISNLVSVVTNLTGGANLRNTSNGMQVANNLVSGVLVAGPSKNIDFGAVVTNNVESATSLGFDPESEEFLSDRDGKGAGKFVDGFSPVGYATPDAGAIQTGVEYPKPGHNFSIRREIEYVEKVLPTKQLLKDNLFREGLKYWTPAGGTVTTVYDSNWNNPENRNSIQDTAVSLSGGGRVEQEVTGLVPGKTYSLWVYRKIANVTTAGIGIVFSDGREYRFVFDSSDGVVGASAINGVRNWQLAQNFEFTVPAGHTKGRVFLWMEGPGNAYFDNVGMMQKWHDNTLHYDPTFFTEDPANRSAAVGGGVTFNAKSGASSLRVNRWEWCAGGTDQWLPLVSSPGIVVNTPSGNNAPSLVLSSLKPDQNGDAFRCVSTYKNYRAFSAPGKLSVTGVTLDKADNRVGLGERAYQVTVNVPTGTPWTVVSNLPWVTVSPSSGTGGGTVTLTIAANSTGADREGVIRIAGRDHLVRQINGELFGDWVESLGAPMRTAAATPAGDGVANLLKYAYGLNNPLAPAHAWQPSIGVDDGIGFRFYRAPQRKDLTYLVRASDTLGTRISEWPIIARATAGGQTAALADGLDVAETALGNDLVEVNLALPSVQSSRRFYILEVHLTDEE